MSKQPLVKQKIDEAQIWGEIPKQVEIETVGGEKVSVILRFPAKKELQVIALIRKELKSAESEIAKLVEEELSAVDQVGMMLEYIPKLSIQMASLLMEKEETWVEENLPFSEIAKVVKPFFMNWLGILGLTTLEDLLPLGLGLH